jgi:hypothetical protein
LPLASEQGSIHLVVRRHDGEVEACHFGFKENHHLVECMHYRKRTGYLIHQTLHFDFFVNLASSILFDFVDDTLFEIM